MKANEKKLAKLFSAENDVVVDLVGKMLALNQKFQIMREHIESNKIDTIKYDRLAGVTIWFTEKFKKVTPEGRESGTIVKSFNYNPTNPQDINDNDPKNRVGITYAETKYFTGKKDKDAHKISANIVASTKEKFACLYVVDNRKGDIAVRTQSNFINISGSSHDALEELGANNQLDTVFEAIEKKVPLAGRAFSMINAYTDILNGKFNDMSKYFGIELTQQKTPEASTVKET